VHDSPLQRGYESTPDRGGPESLAREIIADAHALGFVLAGVSEARPSDHAEHVRAWLAAGKHGEMDYLANHLEQRLDPNAMLRGVRSIIAVGDLYTQRGEGASRERIPPDHGRLARYARGKDYHRVMKKRLHALCDALRSRHQGHKFRACVDIEPTLEREHAERAGIGWVGKHTLLIHPEHGSYFMLGLILTTLPLEAPAEQSVFPDHCGGCTRCIDACPTGAIAPADQPRSVDASRCVSYHTLETRGGVIPAEFHAPMRDMLAGCDICQEVCPHNSPNRSSDAPIRDDYAPRFTSLPLLDVLNWTPTDRAARLTGMALKRATLLMWKRNALIAAGNAIEDPLLPAPVRAELLERVRELSGDADPVIRETAAGVLGRLAE
jgi:epoxyqueuosine reductase